MSCLKRIGIKKPGTDEFYDHPFLSKAGGEYLLSKVLRHGIDAINLDNTSGTQSPIHDMYSAASGIIVENLANLDAMI